MEILGINTLLEGLRSEHSKRSRARSEWEFCRRNCKRAPCYKGVFFERKFYYRVECNMKYAIDEVSSNLKYDLNIMDAWNLLKVRWKLNKSLRNNHNVCVCVCFFSKFSEKMFQMDTCMSADQVNIFWCRLWINSIPWECLLKSYSDTGVSRNCLFYSPQAGPGWLFTAGLR